MAARPNDVSAAALLRLRRLNELLEIGLALPEQDRAQWLSELDEHDPELILRLRALILRAAVDTDDFLSGSANAAISPPPEPGDRPGDEVGPYRLLEPLGQGGMASVWLAERQDGHVNRRVALKLPMTAWGGPALVRRMARERSILAALEHPRIARLYEAGVTASGRPWLAMERVEGQPLDQWWRQQQPGLHRLLELFLQIADAVSYAHAHLVVHRDLKPANVLVDAAGDAHLLDFGVAKLLDEQPDELDRQLTRQMGRAVTPDYAAPEQLGNRPITVACDVYSLGVLLYEMVTGKRPYRLVFESYGEMEAAALAAVVPQASTAAQRHDPQRARALRGDLDTILAKALSKDPKDRYASAAAMADDIRRHLDGRPVLARRPSWAYVAAKTVRRHRVAVFTALAVVTSLGVGLAAALWQWQAAVQERDYSAQLLMRTQAAEDFTNTVMTEGLEVGDRLTQDELLQRSKAFVDRQPHAVARAAAASTLAGWYISRGDFAQAQDVLGQAIPQLDMAQEPELLQFMRCQQGHVWSEMGKGREAEDRLLQVARHPAVWPGAAAYCLRILAIRARNENDGKAAKAYADEAMDRLTSARGARQLERALISTEQALAEGLLGRPELADLRFGEALQQLREQGLGESLHALALLQSWSVSWQSAGQPVKSWPLLEQAAAIARKRSPNGELPVMLSHGRAQTLRALGRWEECLRELQPLGAAVQRGRTSPREEMSIWMQYFYVYALTGRVAEAVDAHDRALKVAAVLKFSAGSPGAWSMALSSARRHLLLGEPVKAEAAMDQWLGTVQRAGLRTGNEARALLTRAQSLQAQGRLAEALRDLESALQVHRDQLHGTQAVSWLSGQIWLQIAKVQQQASRQDAAQEAFKTAHQHLDLSVGPDHPETREAAAGLSAATRLTSPPKRLPRASASQGAIT